jgi:hypothetical protein
MKKTATLISTIVLSIAITGCSNQATKPTAETVTVREEITTEPPEETTTEPAEETTFPAETTVEETSISNDYNYEELAEELVDVYTTSVVDARNGMFLVQKERQGEYSLTSEEEDWLNDALDILYLETHPILKGRVEVPSQYADCNNYILEAHDRGRAAVEHFDNYLEDESYGNFTLGMDELMAAEGRVNKAQACFGFDAIDSEPESTYPEEDVPSDYMRPPCPPDAEICESI